MDELPAFVIEALITIAQEHRDEYSPQFIRKVEEYFSVLYDAGETLIPFRTMVSIVGKSEEIVLVFLSRCWIKGIVHTYCGRSCPETGDPIDSFLFSPGDVPSLKIHSCPRCGGSHLLDPHTLSFTFYLQTLNAKKIPTT